MTDPRTLKIRQLEAVNAHLRRSVLFFVFERARTGWCQEHYLPSNYCECDCCKTYRALSGLKRSKLVGAHRHAAAV